MPTPLCRREDFRHGHALNGPAILEQMDSTTVLFPGQRLEVDAFLNLHILLGGTA
jgi:N-methylhydantoinase A